MKTDLLSSPGNSLKSISCKSCLLLIAALSFIGNNVIAGTTHAHSGKDKTGEITKKAVYSRKVYGKTITAAENPSALKINGSDYFGVPAVSYAGPKVYTAGSAITPLSPTGGGAGAPAYSSTTTILGSGFNIPAGVAVDAAGNVYIGDQNNNVVKKIPAGSNTPVVIGTGFATPDGVAVDAAGNVYVADDGNNLVKEIPFNNGSYGAPVVLGAAYTFSQPFDVAVDTKGNVYAADRGHNAVVEIPVGGGAPFTIGSGFATPTGVGTDAYGNVYVADNGNSAIKMIPVGGGAPITLGSGFSNPFKVAVDGSGNVFVTDYGNKLVKEIPINGGPIQTVGSGYTFIFGVAIDQYNNVFVTNYGSNAVVKVQPTGGYYISPALPKGLLFNNTTGTISGTPVAASPATDYTITAWNSTGSTSTTLNITVNAVAISYAGPKVYNAGAAITPLVPTISGVTAAPAYSTSTTTLGSGFNIPAGVAVDAQGNIYIGDQNNNAVKKIPNGTGIPVTIATGFSTPDGVAIDAAGNVYVADDGNNLIKEIPFNNGVYGAPVVLGSAYTFSQPFDVAVDTKGNVYAADRGHNAVVEIPVGGGAPFTIGSGFSTPTGVSTDAYGNVYVADNGNSAIKMIPAGGGAPITLGSGFSNPFTATADGSGNVFVADYGNHLIKEIPINGGAIMTVGSGYSFLFGTAVDQYNNVYVTDYGNNAVKKIQPIGGYYISPALPKGMLFNNTTGTISGTPVAASPATNYTITAYNQYGSNSTTVNITVNAVAMSYAGPKVYTAGTAITPLAPTGGGASAPAYSTSTTTLGSGFNIPAGVAVDAQGNIFIGDQNNNVVKKIPNGTGTPIIIATGFATPDGVAIDAAGNVYVADDGNNLIKEIPFNNGVYGAPVVLGSAYTFSQPFDVAVDSKGNVYAADRGHNAVVEIPVGGGAPFTIGSGFATPTGVSTDAYGNVYVADNGNSAVKMIPAGGGAPVTLGSGFSNPFTAAVDGSGNVFVSDYGNHLIKEIPINGGAIMTVGSGYSFLFGTAVDQYNNVYVTDYGNNAVKKIQPIGGYYISPALPKGLLFNNTTGTISGTPVAASPATNYTITAYNQFGSNSTTLNITVNAVTMSYAGPKVYTAGSAITPLAPTGGGAAAPAYSTTTTTLGSGFNIPAGIAVDAQGNIFIGDQNNNVVKKIPGGTGTPVTIATGFATPDGVAIDAAGNVYVADDGNNLIKKIPFNNGVYGAPVVLGSSYTFSQPFDVAVDTKGNVYAADRGHNAVVEIPVGGGAPFTIGSGFATPTGVSTDAYGNVYVADNGNSAIKMIPAGGGAPVTLGSGFANPFTASVDGSGNVFVSDYGNHLIKEIPINGGAITTVGSGYSFLFGTAVDQYNNVYVTDYGNNAVKKIQPIGGYYISPALPQGLLFNNTTGTISGTPTKASPATDYTITAYNGFGSNSTTINITVTAVTLSYASPKTYVAGVAITPLAPTGSGAAAPAYSTSTTTLGSGFNIPAGIAVDAQGNIFIGDQNNNVVKKIPGGTGTPVTIATGFATPDGIAIDAAGNVYVADDGNNLVKKIPFNNGVYGAPVVIGTGYTFSQPFDVAVDTKGNVYAADRGHNAVVEIPVGGGTPFTIGSGFATPTGVSTDAYGNVYVADNGNSAVKMIPVGGGAPVTLGSGFANPFTATPDGSGNVFVADYGNHLIKEIPINGGAIMTVGSGFSFLFGTAVDQYNNVYVTDYGNNAVKKIQPIGGYYISPALPQGLLFNNTTGTISGTPATASPATNYTITAYSAYGSTSTTLNLKVTGNVNLSNLAISTGVLTPAFSASHLTYAESVANATASLTLTPTAFDQAATITVNGATVVSGTASAPIPLAVGLNPIPVQVIAADGMTTQTYTVTVTRPPSNNALLASISTLPAATLVGTTGPGYLNFTASVPNSVSSMQVVPTAKDPTATITVNGTPVTSGTASQAIALTEGGQTVITTVLTAQDGTTTKTVIITVTRAPSANATLSNIALSIGTLSPTFASNTTSYTTSVSGAIDAITLTPTTTDPGATVKVNGTTVTSGTASQPIPLSLGQNVITTIVTANDGVTTKTYTLTVTRIPSNNALLATISTLPVATLVGTTGPGYLNFTAGVPNSVGSLQIVPTAKDPNATIKVGNFTVASGQPSPGIPLAEGGQTVITIVITAQDGITVKTVIITVNRAASADATLSNIALSSGTLTPAFAANTLNYTASVSNATTTVKITPLPNDANSSVAVNGTTLTAGSFFLNVPLMVGANVITTVVTAQNGTTTKTYTVTVTRVSNNALLQSIATLPAATLVGTTGPGYLNFTVGVPNSQTSIQVVPTAKDPTATITVNGIAVASGLPSPALSLAVGQNVITTVLTAQDGVTTKTVIITVTRAPSTNANLANLIVSTGTLVPAFTTATTGYSVSEVGTVSSITVEPVAADPTASITVNGQQVVSGNPSASIPLAVGPNTITVIVTAQNGTTTKTYTVTVTRVPSNNAQIATIATLPNLTLVGASGPGYLNFTAAAPNSLSSVEVVPTAKDVNATIMVNGMPVTSGQPSQGIALAVGANVINTVITAQDGVTTKLVVITVNRASPPGSNSFYEASSVTKPADNVTLENDGIVVHPAVSPNGDGVNDALTIDGITNYPDNHLTIIDRNGILVYETKGYDNSSRLFDGHSNGGKMQLPGTYFYSLDYTVNGESRHKTGYIVLKY